MLSQCQLTSLQAYAKWSCIDCSLRTNKASHSHLACVSVNVCAHMHMWMHVYNYFTTEQYLQPTFDFSYKKLKGNYSLFSTGLGLLPWYQPGQFTMKNICNIKLQLYWQQYKYPLTSLVLKSRLQKGKILCVYVWTQGQHQVSYSIPASFSRQGLSLNLNLAD